MRINVSVGLVDLLVFQRYYLETDKQIRKTVLKSTYIVPTIFVVSAAVLFYLYHDTNKSMIILAVYLWAMSLLWVFLIPRSIKKGTLKRYKAALLREDHSALTTPRTMYLNEEGIEIDASGTRSNVEWGEVVKVADTGDYFYIFLSAISAHIIPKRELTIEQNERLKSLFAPYILK